MTGSEEPTFQDVIDWHQEQAEAEAESFPGDLPHQGIEATVVSAAQLESIVTKARVYEANEEVDTEGLAEQTDQAIAKQCLDVLAGVINVARERDLDLVQTFKDRAAQVRAMEAADSVEELQDAIDEAGLDMQIVNPGIEPGDDVTDDDYDPDDPDKGVY